MKIIDSSGIINYSSYNQLTDFSVNIKPIQIQISSMSSGITTINHSNYNTFTGATVDNVCQFIPVNTLNQNSSLILTNLSSGIGILDNSYNVTRISDGNMNIKVSGIQGIRKLNYHIFRASGITSNSFLSFVSGSLELSSSNMIDNAIFGKIPSSTTQNIFSSTNIRNINLFANINLTCIAQGGNATAITPLHVIEAAHDPFGTFTFIGSDGSINSRTVVHSDGSPAQSNGDGAQIKIPNTDIAIMRLNSPLPSSITPAKLLPSNFRNYLVDISKAVPVIFTNQFRTLCVGEWIAYNNSQNFIEYPQVSGRQPWYSVPITGDSGSPTFLWFGSGLALITCWTTPTFGPIESDYISQINSAITILGSGSYSVNTIDLSSYIM